MSKVSRLRWVILGLLFAATAISYIDRQTLAVIAPVLRERLGISNSDYAFVLSCFLFAYTVMQAIAGWLIDRFGTRTGFALIMVWWSVATMLHALGTDLASFALFRILLGAGEAGSWAACVKAVSEWFPAQERGLANSLWGLGVSAGQIVSVPLVAWITITLDWRFAFIVTGLFGFTWLLAWLKFYRVPASEAHLVTPESPRRQEQSRVAGARPLTYGQLLEGRNLWAIVIMRVLVDPCVWFYNYWTPTYLAQGGGFTMEKIGNYGWIPFVFQGMGLFLGGLVSDVLCRRGMASFASRFTMMVVGILFAVPALFIVFEFPFWYSFLAISLAMMGFGIWAPNVMTLIGDTFPTAGVASVTGLSGMGAGFGGMLFMLLAGAVIERFGFTPMFVISALVPAAALVLFWFLFDRASALGGASGCSLR